MGAYFQITNSYMEGPVNGKSDPEDFYKTKMKTFKELHNMIKAVCHTGRRRLTIELREGN